MMPMTAMMVMPMWASIRAIEGPDAGGGDGGEDGDGVDGALVEHLVEHDVDREERGEDEHRHGIERRLELGRRALGRRR